MNGLKFKKILKRLPVLGKFLISINRYIIRKNVNRNITSYDSPSIWLKKLLKGDKIQIVQIGSNDGITCDPIYELVKINTEWKALFVEPIPYLFEKLKKNYGQDSRFIFENVAINDGSQQIFYTVKEEAKIDLPDLPSIYDQLGSFDKEHILKHLNGVLEPYIEELLLSGLTLEELFKRNKIKEITLLHIDTEGYDWKILSQLNFNYLKPKLILIEHIHLNNEEKDNLIIFLKMDYFIFMLGEDILAVINNHERKKYIKRLKGVPIS